MGKGGQRVLFAEKIRGTGDMIMEGKYNVLIEVQARAILCGWILS